MSMEHISPLIQTVLWVGLVAAIVWRFHIPIYGILAALQKRVESGASVKAGPFEISERLGHEVASGIICLLAYVLHPAFR